VRVEAVIVERVLETKSSSVVFSWNVSIREAQGVGKF